VLCYAAPLSARVMNVNGVTAPLLHGHLQVNVRPYNNTHTPTIIESGVVCICESERERECCASTHGYTWRNKIHINARRTPALRQIRALGRSERRVPVDFDPIVAILPPSCVAWETECTGTPKKQSRFVCLAIFLSRL
jgi:hypothetical protein